MKNFILKFRKRKRYIVILGNEWSGTGLQPKNWDTFLILPHVLHLAFLPSKSILWRTDLAKVSHTIGRYLPLLSHFSFHLVLVSLNDTVGIVMDVILGWMESPLYPNVSCPFPFLFPNEIFLSRERNRNGKLYNIPGNGRERESSLTPDLHSLNMSHEWKWTKVAMERVFVLKTFWDGFPRNTKALWAQHVAAYSWLGQTIETEIVVLQKIKNRNRSLDWRMISGVSDLPSPCNPPPCQETQIHIYWTQEQSNVRGGGWIICGALEKSKKQIKHKLVLAVNVW